MNWHTPAISYKAFLRTLRLIETGSPIEDANQVAEALRKNTPVTTPKERIAVINTMAFLRSEGEWVQEKRPYYNIWPSVIEAFRKVDLAKVQMKDINIPLKQLLIRFPIGMELGGRIRSILVARINTPNGEDGWITALDDGQFLEDGVPWFAVKAMRKDNGSILDKLQDIRENYHLTDSYDLSTTLDDDCQRIVAAICLLGDNPDLIEPAPLEADREKWERTHDPKLLEKAAKRGKRGWDIGKHVEVAPGYRNPHFAIRWMGHGLPKKPVLRPIKGCLVRKKQVLDIPTDWLDQPRQTIPLLTGDSHG